MKKLVKEPLVHFLLIGATLFLVYYFSKNRITQDEIVVDKYVIQDLSSKWKLQWKREPTSAELTKLIGLYINQEVLYKEALAMNLDHNDEIIKRRLAKKMEFISDDLAESLQPSKEQLRAYYEDNEEDYKKPPIYTFTQLFFKSHAAAALAYEKDRPQEYSDKLSIPMDYVKTGALKISIDFGNAFTASLDTLQSNIWEGPVKSGYGYHLVFIREKQKSGFYAFEDVLDDVTMDYNYKASNDFKEELTSSLLKKYKVSFEIENEELKKKLLESY